MIYLMNHPESGVTYEQIIARRSQKKITTKHNVESPYEETKDFDDEALQK